MTGREQHLLVDISAHGYGHATMTAPVVNELAVRIPHLRITVRSGVPQDFLRQRFSSDFDYIPAALDFGMRMANAVEVDVAQSALDYRAFHADWDGRVARAAEVMRALQPDLVLANVPYLSLAAAHRAGIPAVGMCCLNWADIYGQYLKDDVGGDTIHAQMVAAYNSAAMFLRVQPAMPMAWLANARDVGPIARVSRERRAEIAACLPQSIEERLVLVAMGGLELRVPVERWPHIPGIRWLVPKAWRVERHDVTPFDSLGLPFSDVLASCDVVVTKPAYGTFAEAACAGVPVLYLSRGDWPEEPSLVSWMQRHGVCLEVERERLWRGELQDLLARLLSLPRPARVQATGAAEAAQLLRETYF